MAMNLQFLIFRKCRSGDVKGFECSFVGGGSNRLPLAVHCLLHHGGEKFDVLTIAELAKSEEVAIRLIKMGHALYKRSEEFSASMEFADVEDDTKEARTVSSAVSCEASAVTVQDTDDEDGDDNDDGEDGEDCDNPDGVHRSASTLAARLLLSFGGNDRSSTIGSTPVNASSLGAINTTTTKPRMLEMGSIGKSGMESRASGGAAGRDSLSADDNDIDLLAQDDAALRDQDKRDATVDKEKNSTLKQKKVSTNDFSFPVSCSELLLCCPVPGYLHHRRSWLRAGDCGKG
jgi:hypothetical protein